MKKLLTAALTAAAPFLPPYPMPRPLLKPPALHIAAMPPDKPIPDKVQP